MTPQIMIEFDGHEWDDDDMHIVLPQAAVEMLRGNLRPGLRFMAQEGCEPSEPFAAVLVEPDELGRWRMRADIPDWYEQRRQILEWQSRMRRGGPRDEADS